MKKFTVKPAALAIAAVATGYAATATAQVNLDGATVAPELYASEQAVPATGVNLAGVTATAALGASFAANAQAYVRIDLAGGTFNTAPTYAINDCLPNGAVGSAATTSVAQSASNSVIFSVAPAAGNSLGCSAGGVGTITISGVRVTSQSAVSMQYRLYETLTAAANPSTQPNLKDTGSDQIVAFAPSVSFNTTAGANPVASVTAVTGSYSDFTTSGIASLGSYDFDDDSANVSLQNGDAATTARILNNAALTITGDFSYAANNDGSYNGAALGRVSLRDSAACAGNLLSNAVTLSATSATFAATDEANLATNVTVCVTPNSVGLKPFQASDYTGALAVTALTGFSLSAQTVDLASIERDGTVLRAPYAAGVGGQSTWIQVANQGSIPAPWYVDCFSGTANGRGTAFGTLGAGRTGKLFLANLGCPAGTNSVAITFEVNSGVTAELVRTSTTTGDSAFDALQ